MRSDRKTLFCIFLLHCFVNTVFSDIVTQHKRSIDYHNVHKQQGKLEVALSRLEKMETLMTNKDAEMAADISEALVAVDNFRSSQDLTEEVITEFKKISAGLNLDAKFFSLENQLTRLGDVVLKTDKDLDDKLNYTKTLFVENKNELVLMKKEIKDDLNNYAVKVSELGTFKGKSESGIPKQLNTITKMLNWTQTNMQNGMRSLMVQVGKLGKISTNISENFTEELENNIQKVLSNQEIFLESCHRVQMDEAQIESEISTTLEKLIDMLSKKQDLELKEIKNIEKIIKNHDSKIYKALNIANNNILTLFDANGKQTEKVTNELQKICHDIDALFTVIKDSMHSISKRNETYINVLLAELGLIKTRLNYIQYESFPDLSPDLNDIKQMLNSIKNSTHYNEDIQQIIKTLNNIEISVNNSFKIVNEKNLHEIKDSLATILYTYLKKNQTEQLDEENINTTTENLILENTTLKLSNEDIEQREKSILDIFGVFIKKDNNAPNITFNNSDSIVVTEPNKKCRINILGLIDVRNRGTDCDETTDATIEDMRTTTYDDLKDIQDEDEYTSPK
ncbi:unnamed protein product [Brassicogethes aeneus]|uniref:Uncharacterized protein n=1 Tax=Brassicogethes aeneus TaxID=1431903 RepID=A0A9P0B6L0_BRAAE|nr:unnamed protein product [Brassicogethes aeneus]